MTVMDEIEAVDSVRSAHVIEQSVTTDASGNFVFTNPPTGSQVLLIDGLSRPRVRDGATLQMGRVF